MTETLGKSAINLKPVSINAQVPIAVSSGKSNEIEYMVAPLPEMFLQNPAKAYGYKYFILELVTWPPLTICGELSMLPYHCVLMSLIFEINS